MSSLGGFVGSRYVQCLVCGRVTPVDKGICYHCGSPLPRELAIPPGMVVCPNCLKVTSVESGYCRHCRAPLPRELVVEALRPRRRSGGLLSGRLVLGYLAQGRSVKRVYKVGVI